MLSWKCIRNKCILWWSFSCDRHIYETIYDVRQMSPQSQLWRVIDSLQAVASRQAVEVDINRSLWSTFLEHVWGILKMLVFSLKNSRPLKVLKTGEVLESRHVNLNDVRFWQFFFWKFDRFSYSYMLDSDSTKLFIITVRQYDNGVARRLIAR